MKINKHRLRVFLPAARVASESGGKILTEGATLWRDVSCGRLSMGSRKSRVLIILALLVSGVMIPAMDIAADPYPPSPPCTTPYKPNKFDSESEANYFNREVESYKKCLTIFIDRQKEAAEQHSRAADATMKTWKKYLEQAR